MRLHAQTATIENGFVFIPTEAHWLDDYIHELTVYPQGRHDDQVDSTSQAFAWSKQRMKSWGIYELYRREYELAHGLREPIMVKVRANNGSTHVQTMSGKQYAGENGVFSIPENDVPPLIAAGFERI